MITTVVGMSTIPTVSRANRSPNPYKYWWLRSPDRSDYYAWIVWPFGDVHNSYDNGANGVDSSYDRESPGTDSSDYAWQVYPSGGIYDYDDVYVYSTYGRTFSLSVHGLDAIQLG